MALFLLILFVLLQPRTISASGFLKHEKACGIYHISHLDDPSHELFYINGKFVDRYFFCKALRDYHGTDCKNLGSEYCLQIGIIKLWITCFLFCHFLFHSRRKIFIVSWSYNCMYAFGIVNVVKNSCILQTSCLCWLEENP